MGIKSTVKEKTEAYLESLSEKQKRGILIAMLVFVCIASGIVLLRAASRLRPAHAGMELPFGKGIVADTLRLLPFPAEESGTNTCLINKQSSEHGKDRK